MPHRRKRTTKGLINQLIDQTVHPKGVPSDLDTIIIDEALHAVVEGRFRGDKMLKYTIIPNIMRQRRE